jgi:EAL domain-containing protein (putative c-di-GMP-specific phosphodiesterase class I)
VPVIAEMIEPEAECQRLAELEASFGQGWLFARPQAEPPTRRPPTGCRLRVREEWG